MKSKILSLVMLILIVVLALSACGDPEEHTHTWEAATCITAKTCTECGIETGTVSATNHNYGEWETVKEVSCTEDGLKKQTCSWCNDEKTETLTATGHNYVDGICGNCKENEPITFRDIKFYDKGDYYEWWLGVENTFGELVKATATVTYEQYNGSDLVYKNTFTVTPDDFTEMTRSNGDIELRGLIIVNKADMKPGVNDIGRSVFYVKINGETYIQDSQGCNGLPQIKTTLVTATSLPKIIYNKSYSGNTTQMIKVTGITYKIVGNTMYIYFSGEKVYDREGDNYSRSSSIGYKIYDSEGYVIDSGTAYITALKVGDKFKDEVEYIYNITLGESYTIELLDVD